jgi:hypothetical protein
VSVVHEVTLFDLLQISLQLSACVWLKQDHTIQRGFSGAQAPCSSSLLQKLLCGSRRSVPLKPGVDIRQSQRKQEEADELSRVGAEIAASSVVSIEIGTVLLGFAAYRIHDPEHGA